MHLSTILVSSLVSMAFAALEARQTQVSQQPRCQREQHVTDTCCSAQDAGFQSAASALISGFIPSPVFSELSASVVVAASVASVTGDANSLIYSALEASCLPVWFLGAVPTTYLGDLALLEVQLAALRTAIPPPPPQLTTAAGPGVSSGAVSPAVPTEGVTSLPSLTVVPVTVTQTSITTIVTLSAGGGGVQGSTGVNGSGSTISGGPGSGPGSVSTASTASAPASGTTLATSSSLAAAASTGVVGHLAGGIVAAFGAFAAL